MVWFGRVLLLLGQGGGAVFLFGFNSIVFSLNQYCQEVWEEEEVSAAEEFHF